jgi:hypothetical protein
MTTAGSRINLNGPYSLFGNFQRRKLIEDVLRNDPLVKDWTYITHPLNSDVGYDSSKLSPIGTYVLKYLTFIRQHLDYSGLEGFNKYTGFNLIFFKSLINNSMFLILQKRVDGI